MRLNTQTAVIENGFVHIPETAPWIAEYLHEMAVFPKGKHDDQEILRTVNHSVTLASGCQMNTRQHCSRPPQTGTGGQRMPRSTTASSRTGFEASPLNAGFRIPRTNCSISPDGTTREPIVSAAELPIDDRRAARLGILGHSRFVGCFDAAAHAAALAASALARANLTGEGSPASSSWRGGQADLLLFPGRDRQRRVGA